MHKVRAYCIRGLWGAVFSRGMDALVQELNKIEGVSATVEGHSLNPVWGVVGDLTQAGIKSTASGRLQVIVGHSYGGYAAEVVAHNWWLHGIKTALLGLVDTTVDSPFVPETGGIRMGWWQNEDPMGRGHPDSMPGASTPLIYRQLHNVPHAAMDDEPGIHREICDIVRRIAQGQ